MKVRCIDCRNYRVFAEAKEGLGTCVKDTNHIIYELSVPRYCTHGHLGSYLTLLYQNASPDMLKFSISFNYSTKGTGNFICYTCDIPISGESEALSVIDIIKSYGFGAGFLASTVAAKILSVARNTDLSRSTPNLFSRPNAKYNF